MNVEELTLRAYRPRLAVRRGLTELPDRPPAPIVDAHNHLGRWLTGGWAVQDVGALLAALDACGVETVVNLDGMWGDELEANLDRYDRAHPGRFLTVAHGARGLKVWKDLGLHLRDPAGELVFPDDARLDPVWDEVAAAGVPVTIHTADPVAFFEPLDERNERWEELAAHPDWWFGDRDRFPTFDRLMASLESLVARRSDVTWIGAHVLCAAEDLAWVGRMLDTYPNVHADTGARLAELGRVPRAARDLIVRHPDRFLFGTDDSPTSRAVLSVYRRAFETSDEAFAYDVDPDEAPTQGRWPIAGLDLPDDVLAALYSGNARRLQPVG